MDREQEDRNKAAEVAGLLTDRYIILVRDVTRIDHGSDFDIGETWHRSSLYPGIYTLEMATHLSQALMPLFKIVPYPLPDPDAY